MTEELTSALTEDDPDERIRMLVAEMVALAPTSVASTPERVSVTATPNDRHGLLFVALVAVLAAGVGLVLTARSLDRETVTSSGPRSGASTIASLETGIADVESWLVPSGPGLEGFKVTMARIEPWVLEIAEPAAATYIRLERNDASVEISTQLRTPGSDPLEGYVPLETIVTGDVTWGGSSPHFLAETDSGFVRANLVGLSPTEERAVLGSLFTIPVEELEYVPVDLRPQNLIEIAQSTIDGEPASLAVASNDAGAYGLVVAQTDGPSWGCCDNFDPTQELVKVSGWFDATASGPAHVSAIVAQEVARVDFRFTNGQVNELVPHDGTEQLAVDFLFGPLPAGGRDLFGRVSWFAAFDADGQELGRWTPGDEHLVIHAQ